MGKFLIPSIETPVADPKSLQNSVQQLKEAVEIMAGVRGPSPFMMANDQLQSNNDTMWRNRSGFKLLQDTKMTTGNVLLFPNFGEYNHLRLTLWAVPLTVADAFEMQVSADNGATWITSGTYTQFMHYSTTAAAPTGGAPGTGLTSFKLTYANTIVPNSANQFGFSAVYEIDNNAYFKFHSQVLWYRQSDSTVLRGHDFGWAYTSGTGTGTRFNAMKFYTTAGNNFKGNFILEGHK